MYTAVLMLAMASGAESVDFGRRGCNGYNGCSGSYSAHSGCYSSSHGSYHSGCSCSGSYRAGYYGSGYVDRPYYASGGYYAPTEVRQSFYLAPSQSSLATVKVLLPSVDAEVWFDNSTTTQRGMERTYFSPTLVEGSKYVYTVKARWMEDGRAVDRERRVEIQSGQPVIVDFRSNQGEKMPLPKSEKVPSPKSNEKKS